MANVKPFQDVKTSKEIAGTIAQAPRTVRQVQQLIKDIRLLDLDIQQADIEKFLISIMADKTASHRDKLQAARLLSQLKGYIGKDKASTGVNGAKIKWAYDTIDTTTAES